MKQEKNNYCLCAVIQEVFKKYNINISQDEIAKELTPSKKGFEANDEKIKQFMDKNGFNYQFYWNNTTPFNEPDTLIDEISQKGGFMGLDNHTYLLVKMDYDKIKAIDPKDNSMREFNYYSMMKEMSRKNDGCFGLIKKVQN